MAIIELIDRDMTAKGAADKLRVEKDVDEEVKESVSA